ncbi:MAG TPA: hypothetical protein VLK85_35710 [Ramlibacter sp.]|nr:hypothetical protein [Ramlibacter sp.]
MNPNADFIHVSVREARMAVERILLTCELPKGYVPAVRECVLLSQSLGLGGFEALHQAHTLLARPDLARMQAAEGSKHEIEFDGGGLHAWIVLPTALDLAVANARRHGRCELRVRGVQCPEELHVAGALAKRHGAVAHVTEAGDAMVVSVINAARPRTAEQWDPLLRDAILHGWRFGRARWREVYALSNKALAPDSVVSRRHAGPVVVDAEGQLVGRVPVDDETDLRTLTNVN